MRTVGAVLWPKLRVLQIHGANTGVGKTIFSTILCNAFKRKVPRVHYLKPVSTGPANEADGSHISKYCSDIESKTLFQFQEPVSPHIAARLASTTITDAQLQGVVYDELSTYARGDDAVAIVEAAGAVLSPAPSGSTQADAYRPLRMPAFLVGDSRLGGIGSTIAAWESLHLRGYDVSSVALFEEDRYGNAKYLSEYFADRGVSTLAISPPPEQHSSLDQDLKLMQTYYQQADHSGVVSSFVDSFLESQDARVEDIKSMPGRAVEAIWHPFMQHRERSKEGLVVMESAYDDFFQTYMTQSDSTSKAATTGSGAEEKPMLTPAFDGSASWWTQGLGHGNPTLALAAAHAAGRYGHVMFANAVHQPALELAETLLQKMDNPKLTKVFYTDNGSTGMEVAVKMALRATTLRNGWKPNKNIEILGLTGSYHGDTIGTMDCSEPSIYNEKVEWYRGRGHWFDFPQVRMRQGQWIVESPEHLQSSLGGPTQFGSLDDVFDLGARESDAERYRSYLEAELQKLTQDGRKFGALVMEPIILGAGGMTLVDPLFQRCLVDVVRGERQSETDLDWHGMPVVFDEVFTGLYRLGHFSAAKLLGVRPDIVVNAKLLTGGLLPLCTTTASESIFEAFLSDDKSDALLHGHSYTAHAVGCTVANKSLDIMAKLDNGDSWASFKDNWRQSNGSKSILWSMWSQDFVDSISRRQHVDYVFAVGSVLAISLKDPAGSGYASTAAIGVRDQLLNRAGTDDVTVHCRVLGNVLYLMASMTAKAETLRNVQDTVLRLVV